MFTKDNFLKKLTSIDQHLKYMKPIMVSILLLIGNISTAAAQDNFHDNEEITLDLIHKYDIREPECKKPLDETQICQFKVQVTDSLIDYINRVYPDDYKGKYLIDRQDEILNIISINPNQPSFVCCDIQSPFQSLKLPDNHDLSIARFFVPKGVRAEITLFGDVEIIGEQQIGDLNDIYSQSYSASRKDVDMIGEVSKLNVEGFYRTLNIYRSYPGTSPDSVYYFKDGESVSAFAIAVEVHYKRQGLPIPNIALVGIPSGSVAIRPLEYLKNRESPQYNLYRERFSDKIVPSVEAFLGYRKGRVGRRLVGFSDGGAWVYDYFVDYPSFAKAAIALSPGGGIPKSLPPCSNQEFCGLIYIGGGTQEPGFLANAKGVFERLQHSGWEANFEELNSGHSPSTWGPILLKAISELEQTF